MPGLLKSLKKGYLWTTGRSPLLTQCSLLLFKMQFHDHCRLRSLSIQFVPWTKYWMILKKASFGIFIIILVSKEENNFDKESKDKVLSLSKFLWYLVIVKNIKIRHSRGHISQENHDSKIIFVQKQTLYSCLTKFPSFCLHFFVTFMENHS